MVKLFTSSLIYITQLMFESKSMFTLCTSVQMWLPY